MSKRYARASISFRRSSDKTTLGFPQRHAVIFALYFCAANTLQPSTSPLRTQRSKLWFFESGERNADSHSHRDDGMQRLVIIFKAACSFDCTRKRQIARILVGTRWPKDFATKSLSSTLACWIKFCARNANFFAFELWLGLHAQLLHLAGTNSSTFTMSRD